MAYRNSQLQHVLARNVIAGASLTRSKAPGKLFAPDQGPLYASHGDGAVLYDVDGNAFIDMLCALGAISLGYIEMQGYGQTLSLPSIYEERAATKVLEVVAPWASQVRFVKTGSEATHAAFCVARLARQDRHAVLVGDWAYHGWHEWCSTWRHNGRFSDSGQALRFKHGEDLSEYCEDAGIDQDDVAAVFIEPHRWEPVDAVWLRHVRDFCDTYGALLVYDEMVSGLRWRNGGAVELFGVIPDLACYGKALGNGAPIACVVGNETLRAHGEIVSGTYSGEAASLLQACDVLDAYRDRDVVKTLWTRGSQLARELQAAIDGVPGVHHEGLNVHQRLRFDDPAQGKRFSAAMAARGVLWHPDVVNVCEAHTPEQIASVGVAAAESIAALTANV